MDSFQQLSAGQFLPRVQGSEQDEFVSQTPLIPKNYSY